MVCLDRIEVFIDEAANPLIMPDERWMGQRGETICGVNARDYLCGRCAGPRNERRPPALEPSIEGFFRIRDMSSGDEGAGDPRPSSRFPGVLESGRQNHIGVQLHSEHAESCHHLTQAVDAPAALFSQKQMKRRRGHVDEIPEYVKVVIVTSR
jgi:hypothetical protein